MTPGAWGAVCGAAAGTGGLLVVRRVMAIRHPALGPRVLPYLRDVPRPGHNPRMLDWESPRGAAGVFAPLLRSGAHVVERVLGGADSVQRRIDRAGLDLTVHEVRVQQVLWGLVGFAITAACALLRALAAPTDPVPLLLFCVAGLVTGVLARDTRLTSQATSRERRMLEEFPAIAELLALGVAAGEGITAALERVVTRSAGEFSRELGRVLAAVRTGEPVAAAFDALAARTGLNQVARFAQGVAVAVERGTPLADVLHAQAADVREGGRRQLIESAARREVLMRVPVVFLILPITVIFAFWPGAIGLSTVAH